MNIPEILQIVGILISLVAGVGVPLILLAQRTATTERLLGRKEMHDRLDHLDTCMDTTKKLVLSNMITKSDFTHYRDEMQQTLTRIREAVTAEQHGMHDRLLRLESIHLKDAGHG